MILRLQLDARRRVGLSPYDETTVVARDEGRSSCSDAAVIDAWRRKCKWTQGIAFY